MSKRLLDAARFVRYKTVINALFNQGSFYKSDIYQIIKDEKRYFIGRIIEDLIRDGYIVRSGLKTNPMYQWTKKKDGFNPGAWIDQKIFTTTIKRSPQNDRPRERLLRIGPSKLKTSELFAILIRSGLQGESAMQAAERLAAFFAADLEYLSLQARGELKQISRAIGETAYCQLMAALELGKRLAEQKISKTKPINKIRGSEEAISFCKRHFIRLANESRQEEFHVILLDEKFRVIRSELITIGLLNEGLTHPREVFKSAIKEVASALILVHNHPSGDPTPSQEDKLTTRALKKAAATLGLRIVDHIILGKDKVVSMMEKRML